MDEAEQFNKKAQNVADRLQEEMLITQYLDRNGNMKRSLGTVYCAQGSYEEAFTKYEKLLKIKLLLHAHNLPEVAKSHNKIGKVMWEKFLALSPVCMHRQALLIF
ncbi:uncharacterized protein TRIADDRAFT_61358 [Trichoplax adhaerens]|uniref:Uncharacterized protein n=1 Tax=Trichoplax adhaerens TaxID=10228 RepID=B3SAS0_TRIAD|nr:predicted protein [Trichoplax adhaerens]EDV20150.1 predicted protein [Trichoplax adhaerens]|eukprot:XP_002117311.1 predicted protein [Trichoplax adhaerens]